MRVNYLTKEQIDYELLIRDIKTTKKDLHTKRKMLRKLLDKEALGHREYEYDLFDFDVEKDAINQTIEVIRGLIEQFEGPETDSGFIRITTNLIHLMHRVNRIPIDSDDAEMLQYISNFKNEAKATCLELEALASENLQHPVVAETSPANFNSTVMHNTSFFPNLVSQNSNKSVPVYKWDLKFSGDKGSSLKSFLERVDELCASRNVSKTELFNSACDLFSHNALVYFRSVKNSVSDWDGLVEKLVTEFLPIDYDDQLWTEIRGRTQAKNESISMFVAIMETLFNRLNKPVAEKTRLKYIRKNILPHFISQLALTSVESISELVNYCKKIEDANSIKNSYRPPQNQCLLEPELAYKNITKSQPFSQQNVTLPYNESKGKKPVNGGKQYHKSSRNVSVINNNQPSTSSSSSKTIVCYNCGLQNHSFKNCRAPRKRFCFKCGKQGETVKTCSCSKNE